MKAAKGIAKIMVVASAILGAPHVEALELVAQRVLADHPFNLYSVERFEGRIWMGAGPFGVEPWDEIYEIGPGCAPRKVYSRPGYHVNDPSIVVRADGAWTMYHTSAPFDADNTISVLLSSDQGATWTLRADIIPDGGSPSAFVEPLSTDIFVYYTPFEPGPPGVAHSPISPQQVWMSRRGPWGLGVYGPPEVVRLPDGSPWAIGNIDVTPFGYGYNYIAVGNRSLGEVFVAFSNDGINFTWPELIVAGNGSLVTAPHVTSLGNGYFAVSFSVSFDNTVTYKHFVSWEWMWSTPWASGPVPAGASQGVCSDSPPPPPTPPPPPPGGGQCLPWQTTIVIVAQTYCQG